MSCYPATCESCRCSTPQPHWTQSARRLQSVDFRCAARFHTLWHSHLGVRKEVQKVPVSCAGMRCACCPGVQPCSPVRSAEPYSCAGGYRTLRSMCRSMNRRLRDGTAPALPAVCYITQGNGGALQPAGGAGAGPGGPGPLRHRHLLRCGRDTSTSSACSVAHLPGILAASVGDHRHPMASSISSLAWLPCCRSCREAMLGLVLEAVSAA